MYDRNTYVPWATCVDAISPPPPPHPTACTVRDRADRKANDNGMLCDAILLDSSLNLSVASVHAALALATAVEVLSHGFRAGFSVHLGIMISGASLHNVA